MMAWRPRPCPGCPHIKDLARPYNVNDLPMSSKAHFRPDIYVLRNVTHHKLNCLRVRDDFG